MNEQLKQLGLTPIKAGAIGALLLVLAAVWGPQLAKMFGGGSRPTFADAAATRFLAEPTSSPAARAKPAPRNDDQPDTRDEPARRVPARVYTVTEAIAYDPFRAPGWAPPSKRQAANGPAAEGDADRLAQITELQETGVAMVLVSGSQKVAAIGDRLVRLGDEIAGYRVVEISSDGVLLQPTNPPPPTGGPRGL